MFRMRSVTCHAVQVNRTYCTLSKFFRVWVKKLSYCTDSASEWSLRRLRSFIVTLPASDFRILLQRICCALLYIARSSVTSMWGCHFHQSQQSCEDRRQVRWQSVDERKITTLSRNAVGAYEGIETTQCWHTWAISQTRSFFGTFVAFVTFSVWCLMTGSGLSAGLRYAWSGCSLYLAVSNDFCFKHGIKSDSAVASDCWQGRRHSSEIGGHPLHSSYPSVPLDHSSSSSLTSASSQLSPGCSLDEQSYNVIFLCYNGMHFVSNEAPKLCRSFAMTSLEFSFRDSFCHYTHPKQISTRELLCSWSSREICNLGSNTLHYAILRSHM